MEDNPIKQVYEKVCPVCHKPFETTSRNQKYCDNPACAEFAQKRVGKLRKRRRARDLNRQFHIEWVRRHRADREAYLNSNKIAVCQDCGLERLNKIGDLVSKAYMAVELSVHEKVVSSESVISTLAEALIILQAFREQSMVPLKDLEVHHKDGNFKNADPTNLVGLCDPCHKKAESELHKAGKVSDEQPHKEDSAT